MPNMNDFSEPPKSDVVIQKIKIDLHDYRDPSEGEISGEQLKPVRAEIQISSANIIVDFTLPSGVSHQIGMELDKGLVSLVAFVSLANRASAKEDLGFTHDAPVVTAKFGVNRSFFEFSADNASRNFTFDHVTGVGAHVGAQYAESLLLGDQAAIGQVASGPAEKFYEIKARS